MAVRRNQRIRTRFGVAVGMLAVLLLAFLAPLQATAQFRTALGAESLPYDLFASTQLCGGGDHDSDSSPKGLCEHCVLCGRLLLAAPALDAPSAAWSRLPSGWISYRAEGRAPFVPDGRGILPEVRGPPAA